MGQVSQSQAFWDFLLVSPLQSTQGRGSTLALSSDAGQRQGLGSGKQLAVQSSFGSVLSFPSWKGHVTEGKQHSIRSQEAPVSVQPLRKGTAVVGRVTLVHS